MKWGRGSISRLHLGEKLQATLSEIILALQTPLPASVKQSRETSVLKEANNEFHNKNCNLIIHFPGLKHMLFPRTKADSLFSNSFFFFYKPWFIFYKMEFGISQHANNKPNWLKLQQTSSVQTIENQKGFKCWTSWSVLIKQHQCTMQLKPQNLTLHSCDL